MPEFGNTNPNQTLLLDETPLQIIVENIDQYSPTEFTVLRRQGLGGSDSSILCGVNPFSTERELIDSKVRVFPTEEELGIGMQRNVRAGNDMEPIIIDKFNTYFPQYKIFKPKHMYQFKDTPYLSMNFDGVGLNIEKSSRYIPIEIKFISMYGGKYYNFNHAWFNEDAGMMPERFDHSKTGDSIPAKADWIGIPPYYYTQLQQEMMALNAPYGLLCVVFEKTWNVSVFRTEFDPTTAAQIVNKGATTWRQVEKERAMQGLSAADYTVEAVRAMDLKQPVRPGLELFQPGAGLEVSTESE